MKHEIPAMLAGGGGAIVNMASVAGVQAMTNLAAYVAGKAAIIGLTEVAALDYADLGVRVNVVAPGPILTHHLERAGAEAQRLAGQSVPLGRIGTTREVADVVLWLCSEQSSFVTGATVPVDGGQLAGNNPPRDPPPGRGHGADSARSHRHLSSARQRSHHRVHHRSTSSTNSAPDGSPPRSPTTPTPSRPSSPTTSASSDRLGSCSTKTDRSTATARWPATAELSWHDVDIRDYGGTAVTIGARPRRRPTRAPSNGVSGSATCTSAATGGRRSPACSSASRRPRATPCVVGSAPDVRS